MRVVNNQGSNVMSPPPAAFSHQNVAHPSSEGCLRPFLVCQLVCTPRSTHITCTTCVILSSRKEVLQYVKQIYQILYFSMQLTLIFNFQYVYCFANVLWFSAMFCVNHTGTTSILLSYFNIQFLEKKTFT